MDRGSVEKSQKKPPGAEKSRFDAIRGGTTFRDTLAAWKNA